MPCAGGVGEFGARLAIHADAEAWTRGFDLDGMPVRGGGDRAGTGHVTAAGFVERAPLIRSDTQPEAFDGAVGERFGAEEDRGGRGTDAPGFEGQSEIFGHEVAFQHRGIRGVRGGFADQFTGIDRPKRLVALPRVRSWPLKKRPAVSAVASIGDCPGRLR